MEKQTVVTAVKKVIETSPKRKFKQSVDLVINLKELDLKKNDNQIDIFHTLPHQAKPKKICALVGGELYEQAGKIADKVILNDTFFQFQDKKVAKKLAAEFDFFIAQANIMPQVATTFGRVFGPRAKMPNPKAGCVVPPNANLKPLYDRLKKTLRLRAVTEKIIQAPVGTEDMDAELIAENALSVYNAVVHALPREALNVKSIYLKYTMGPAVAVAAEKVETVKGSQ